MSLRAGITGEVIRRLNEVRAEDPQVRLKVYEQFRQELSQAGFAGRSAQEALGHLDSAIRFQEAYWLRETGQSLQDGPARLAEPGNQPAARQAASWRWPRHLRRPGRPPGPRPGPPTGPFSDHVYVTAGLGTPDGPVPLTVGWALDPACTLTAHAAQIGFSFSTRAADLQNALAHLEGFLGKAGLKLPEALKTSGT